MTRTRKAFGFLTWPKQQRGTSTLEFAVVLPTLLIIFLGGMELCRAWLTVNIATNAVREGARTGAASNPVLSGSAPVNYAFDNTTALARLNQVLSSAGITSGNAGAQLVSATVTCTDSINLTPPVSPPPGTQGCTPDSQIDASVTVNFRTVAPLFLPMLSSLTIQETARIRRE